MELGDQVAGFLTTLATMFKRTVTVEYPDAMRALAPRFRGAVGFLPHPETGREKCVGCGLCPQVCPVDAITIGVIEDETPGANHFDEWQPFEHYYYKGLDPTDPDAKKFSYFYHINETRCLYCGLCVEVCPVEALIMSHHFEMATDNRAETIYDKSKILAMGKTYMAELNERTEGAQARQVPGTTLRPSLAGRPARPELPGTGAAAYADEQPAERGDAESGTAAGPSIGPTR
jgi:NADH-quinone oxidoreductase subunit I